MAKKSKALQTAATIDEDAMDVDEPSDLEMHGLEPLPQPEPVAADTSKPTYETLPSWLAEPIRVAPDTRTPFADIGISAKASQALETKGFKDAFAVQTAAIPLLLPSSKHRQGDLLVAAATGSGKTLAYALPIVRDISGGQVTRLRALVVLPTRELVLQAQEVFQMCAAAFDSKDAKKVRIGISIGSQQLKQDQAALVEEVQRYDPRAYKQALRRFRGPWSFVEDSESDEDDEKIMPRPVASHLPDHVVDHKSRVDVLICTPGRLVDHINQTPGFSLDYVRWLVVDEADKLLAQSFQGWLDVVMPLLSTTKFSARDFPGSSLSGVRKVILSATLTRDLSLLGGLQLRWPQLIVLEGGKDGDKAQTAEHTLPSQLAEAAVRVYNTTLKPLYLLEVLQGDHLLAPAGSAPAVVKGEKKADDDTSSEEDSDTSSDESDSDTSSSSRDSDAEPKKPKTPAGAFTKTVLIFTKSNEAALRLSRLLALVSPPLAPLIGTLTSTQKTSHRRRVLSSFASGTLRILVASDLVARGIDLPALDNVVNYDLPASAAGYVHRVGRTARAGRAGKAITLVETRESGWFWGAVGKWAGIRRHADVERVRVGDREAEHVGFDAEKVEAYQEALAELGREAGEKKHK
ncbi:ATP-dependent RNA helicase dbp6 [Plectosphaerella plurivora]|uniref:ATP-dependent RNA helicase n=1 Tax=Plectosphaerella plurivora TaxID=936078 RepID=A0A9P8VF12_9PEZI|nr:ATP-dependent RNA helicase dbp6 [Plectosphaerella plurivora]